MIGFANFYNNGVVIRTVWFNGKEWHDIMVAEGPNKGNHHVAVKSDATQTWPRTFGRQFPRGRR